jgi:O-antigen/teichoic acid export membrane protein
MLENALLTAIGLALIGLSRLAFNGVALRVFGADLSGQLNVALSLGVLLSLPASTAVGATAVRYMAQARGQGRPDTLGWLYRGTLGATLVIAALSAAVAWMFRHALATSQGIDAGLVAQAVVVGTAYVVYLFFRNALYALDRVRLYARLEVVSGVFFFVALAVLALLGLGRWLLAAFVLGQVLFTVAALQATRTELCNPCAPERRLGLAPLVGFSAVALVGTAASLSVRELAVFLSPRATDLAGAAHLALSMSLLAPLQFLPRMFRTVLFAHSAALDGRGERDSLGRSIGTASHWLLLATLPVCGVLVLTGGPLLELLGGTPTPERVLAFRLLTVAAVIDVVATPSANALPGVGAVKAPSYAAVAALVVTVAIWLGFAGSQGLVGLAGGMLVNSVVKGGVPIIAARRMLGATLTSAPVRSLVLAALAAGGVGLLGRWPHPWLVAALYVAAAAPVLWRPAREILGEVTSRLRRRREAAAAPRAAS